MFRGAFLALTLAEAIIAGGARARPAAPLPAPIATDPPPDTAQPMRMEVLHVPSGGVEINGIAYIAPGAGRHPTAVLLHGLPGDEKNLDLAQTVRRAGWNTVVFSYRGAWGSPGEFRIAQTLEDASAVLAFLRDPAHARFLGVDLARLVLIGHSMGGWIALSTAAHDKGLAGVIAISAADMGAAARAPEAERERIAAENMEGLAGVTAQSLAADLGSIGPDERFGAFAPRLLDTPILALTADDGLADDVEALARAIHADGGDQFELVHAATDHAWSDRRILLEATIIRWLQSLPPRRNTTRTPP